MVEKEKQNSPKIRQVINPNILCFLLRLGICFSNQLLLDALLLSLSGSMRSSVSSVFRVLDVENGDFNVGSVKDCVRLLREADPPLFDLLPLR